MKSSIKLRIEGREIQIDSRFAKVSGLLHELIQQEGSDEIYELSSEYVKMSNFNLIKQYYEAHNFEPQMIKIKSEDPQEVLTQRDQELIMKFSPFEGKGLIELIQSSTYLNLQHFKNLCLVRIALEIYVDPKNPQQSLEKLGRKYPTTPPITSVDLENFRKSAPFLFDQYL